MSLGVILETRQSCDRKLRTLALCFGVETSERICSEIKLKRPES